MLLQRASAAFAPIGAVFFVAALLLGCERTTEPEAAPANAPDPKPIATPLNRWEPLASSSVPSRDAQTPKSAQPAAEHSAQGPAAAKPTALASPSAPSSSPSQGGPGVQGAAPAALANPAPEPGATADRPSPAPAAADEAGEPSPPPAPAPDTAPAPSEPPPSTAAPAADADEEPAPTPAPPAPRRQEPEIDPADIPMLPVPPPTQSLPQGSTEPPAPPEAEPEGQMDLGRWRQVSKDNSADFVPGGYTTSEIVFRDDGILEIRRAFGKDAAVVMTWRVGYELNDEKSTVMLGADKTARPSPDSLKGFVIEDEDIVATDAADALPLKLSCKRLDSGQLQMGGKRYAPMSREPEPE